MSEGCPIELNNCWVPMESLVPWSAFVEASWNVMAHAQKWDFIFRWNRWVHLNRRGRQFSRPLAAEVCASAVVMLDTPCTEVVWRVLATHCIRQFPLHFPSRASPWAITFQLASDIWKECDDINKLSKRPPTPDSPLAARERYVSTVNAWLTDSMEKCPPSERNGS